MAVLGNSRKKWLVTGAAGFIGSHLVEALLRGGQDVIGLDNFSTGRRENIDAAHSSPSIGTFRLIEGDIRSLDTCASACEGVDYVLHQAALGSVPRSVKDPAGSNSANVDGFLNVLIAAKEAGVKRVVYASSSSVYGDSVLTPKKEEILGRPLSPYAVTKLADELYAQVFTRTYGLSTIGLRYFNVFGPRQDPSGPYAAVIPCWLSNLIDGSPCVIYGDGKTSRDFCYVDNVVQGNILAAVTLGIKGEVFNIACGESTTLNDLYKEMRLLVGNLTGQRSFPAPRYADFRAGDVRNSLASIDKARAELGYEVLVNVKEGLRDYLAWAIRRNGPPSKGGEKFSDSAAASVSP